MPYKGYDSCAKKETKLKNNHMIISYLQNPPPPFHGFISTVEYRNGQAYVLLELFYAIEELKHIYQQGHVSGLHLKNCSCIVAV